MSSINTLFVLSNSGELEINKLETKKIPEFKVLFDRDLGSIGDYNGSKKYIACAELYYIYLVYDIRSIYYNLPIEEKKVRAKKDSKLPDNWKEDKAFEKAIETYKDIFTLSAAGNAYVVAEKAYYSVTRDAAEMQDTLMNMKEQLSFVLKKLKVAPKTKEVEIVGLLGDATALMLNMTKTQKEMILTIKTFGDLGENVKKLSYKFMEEGGNLKTPVGGGELNNREE
jgi:hypothetical protein